MMRLKSHLLTVQWGRCPEDLVDIISLLELFIEFIEERRAGEGRGGLFFHPLGDITAS